MDKRRLDLRFRPDNIFCKPLYGDVHDTTGILLKVKRRRPKRNSTNDMFNKTEEPEPEIIVLGTIKSIIKFESRIS